METPFVIPVPANPSRAQLRALVAEWTPLRAVPGVAEQLDGLRTLMRLLYSPSSRVQHRTGRRPVADNSSRGSTALIRAEDCMGRCDRCDGSGHLTYKYWSLLCCPDCDGKGKRPVGCAHQHAHHDRPVTRKWSLRGDFTPSDPVSVPAHLGLVHGHTRGLFNDKVLKGVASTGRWSRQFGVEGTGADAIDRAAVAEGRSIARLTTLNAPLEKRVRGKKLRKRPVPKLIAKPVRRERMSDRRLRLLNAELGRPSSERRVRPETRAMQILKSLGLDQTTINALVAAGSAVGPAQTPEIAEACRRGEFDIDTPPRQPQEIRQRCIMGYATKANKSAGVKRGDLLYARCIDVYAVDGTAVDPEEQDILDRHDAETRGTGALISASPV